MKIAAGFLFLSGFVGFSIVSRTSEIPKVAQQQSQGVPVLPEAAKQVAAQQVQGQVPTAHVTLLLNPKMILKTQKPDTRVVQVINGQTFFQPDDFVIPPSAFVGGYLQWDDGKVFASTYALQGFLAESYGAGPHKKYQWLVVP